MWVRSQNKRILTEIHDVEIDSGYKVWCSGSLFGEYSTEEKALKVLDEIQKEIFYLDTHEMTTNTGTWKTNYVYQMPQDDEVGL